MELKSEPLTGWRVLLVSDLRSFTTITETFLPENVVKMLNTHLEEMAKAVREAGGTVERFIGDAVVASFSGDTQSRAAKNALKAARGMMLRHHQIQEDRQKNGEFSYGMGVGLASGPVLIGSIGSTDRREHAIVGRAYERAEELEAISKTGQFSRIVLSEELKELLADVELFNLDENAWEIVSLAEDF